MSPNNGASNGIETGKLNGNWGYIGFKGIIFFIQSPPLILDPETPHTLMLKIPVVVYYSTVSLQYRGNM